jgi:hypothetical protein
MLGVAIIAPVMLPKVAGQLARRVTLCCPLNLSITPFICLEKCVSCPNLPTEYCAGFIANICETMRPA